MIAALCVMLGLVGMEVFVVLFHRYIMHGVLWKIHKTHHAPTKHPLELNDVFVIFFASIGGVLIAYGVPDQPALFLGAGVALYGMLYFVMHDMVIHKRFLRQPLPSNRYLQAVYRMHMAHHKHVSNETGEAYGMFFVPMRYWNTKR
jgi:beta-carotene 3-hydroxylase